MTNKDFMNIKRESAKSMVGKGWSKIIDMLYDELPIPKRVKVYQVKEKFGGLRFYTSGLTPEQDAIITKAERMSEVTCEECGKPGEIKSPGYWLMCRCEDCFEKEYQHLKKADSSEKPNS